MSIISCSPEDVPPLVSGAGRVVNQKRIQQFWGNLLNVVFLNVCIEREHRVQGKEQSLCASLTVQLSVCLFFYLFFLSDLGKIV